MHVYLKKRSKYYQQEGYKYAQIISNRYTMERIFAAALDVCVMFLPIALWALLMLMIVGNILPVFLLTAVDLTILVGLCISIVFFNAMLSAKSGGQSLGRYFYDIKVVKKNRQEASAKTLIIREVLGFSIPTIILLYFFNIFGVIAYWLLNFLFILIHPKHISIIDIFTRTRIVVLHESLAEVEEAVEYVEEPQVSKPVVVSQGTTIDLHIHSNFSDDGEWNVEDIFQKAKKCGMKTISICDHNTVKANPVAIRMSSLYNIRYIPGVELDCHYNHINLRVLGYYINPNSDIFSHLENESLVKNKDASLERIKSFENFTGIHVDVSALMEKNRFQKITGEMIAKQVLHNEVVKDHPMLQPYLIGNRQDNPYKNFEYDFFKEGEPCFVSVRYPKLEDIIDIIKLTGGVPVLCWAEKIIANNEKYLEEILSKGIEGIEVFTSYHDQKEMAQLLKVAKDHKLFVTGGSDFHGPIRDNVEIGQSNCPKEAEKLIQNFIDAH